MQCVIVNMRYHALAADYDGTLAHHGKIDAPTWAALRELREAGRKLVMVTGRQLEELLALLEHPEVFDRIVAENGALIYEPSTKEIRTKCPPPSMQFVEELARRGVERIAVGRAIVATWEPHEDTVFHVIHEMGLELHVIFNKGAVMVLPSGVNKATGLAEAADELGLSVHNIVGIGDAENDHALLDLCECGVAVSNALPVLKNRADLVTEGDHGAGVRELIRHLVDDDLASVAPRLLRRHHVVLGKGDYGPVAIDPYSANIVVCGPSGSGKSTLTNGVFERLWRSGYQFAILDPEGDYAALPYALVLGAPSRAPLVEEVVDVLKDPHRNVVINMLGVALEHRPEFFAQMLPPLLELRTRTGRPHWLVIDEAHHLLPKSWQPLAEIPLRPRGNLYVTVHPDRLSSVVIRTIDTLIVVGAGADQTVRAFCERARIVPPDIGKVELPPGHAVYWRVGDPGVQIVQTEPAKTEKKRHRRKYMEGNLGQRRSFYFRGKRGKLNLRAHNLQLFLHLAEGVDDETWSFHLKNGDYSRWIRTEVKDPELAAELVAIERDRKLSPLGSRAAIRAAVEKRYTAPVDQPSGLIDT